MHTMKLLYLCLMAGGAAGHPLCFVNDRSTDYGQELTFCPAAQDGACCTDTEELAVEALFDAAGTLSDSCADLHKQVVCGVCHSYSAHLYERLGSELGGADGMTMKESFCEELVKECSGEIEFPTYGGLSYCEKHVGSDGDQFWSYPYTEPEIFDTGLTEVFPDLDTGLDFPENALSIHQSPDGSMYWLMGQLGEVKKIGAENPGAISTVVDISGGNFYAGYEEGLLDFAFGPMFGVEGFPQYFYLSHTVLLDDGELQRNRLSKFEYFAEDPDATRDSEDILITGTPRFTDIHAGGWCGFEPSAYGKEASYHDLYWATGDSGPQQDPYNNAQDASNILGSMIRISVPTDGTGYKIPSGNLADSVDDALPEVCANGFRNPFRCGFDRLTDILYCGDVGHSMVEEVDIVQCGKNYGWSRFEGSRCQEAQQSRDGPCADADRSGFQFPFFEYCHVDYYSTSDGEDVFLDGVDICGDRKMTGHAIIGGYVYRGTYFADLLFGAYIFGDSTNRNIYYIKEEGGDLVTGTIVSDGSVAIISFAEDINGEIMMITKTHSLYHMPCGDLCGTTATSSSETCLDQSDSQPSYQDVGCFTDLPSDRVLSLAKGVCESGERTMSPAICAAYCATISGAVYFGVEFSYECFCGGSGADYAKLGTLSDSDCNYTCTNNGDETCGGKYAIQVYELE